MIVLLLLYLVAINGAAFVAFGCDKYYSEHGLYRVPEKFLLTLAAIGGAFGALTGQRFFRHKTRKEPFRTYLYGLVVFNAVFWIAMVSDDFRVRFLDELMRG